MATCQRSPGACVQLIAIVLPSSPGLQTVALQVPPSDVLMPSSVYLRPLSADWIPGARSTPA